MQLHQFSMSPPPVAHVYPHAAAKPEAAVFARSSTPQAYTGSPHFSQSPASQYATPDNRSVTPAEDYVRMDPLRQDSGAVSLATAPIVGPSHMVGHQAATAAAAVANPGPSVAASVQLSEAADEKSPVVPLPFPLPAHPHEAPARHDSIAVGLPASLAAPPRLASTPEPAPPTPASAAGTSKYPGHDGVPTNDPRVTVSEFRAEEGILGLLFAGPEKDYSDAYWCASLCLLP